MGEFLELFKKKNNLITLLILGILILAVPIGINLIKNQQIFKSRAGADPIVFTGTNVVSKNGQWMVIDSKKPISLELTSPLGPPLSSGPTASPSPAVTTCSNVALSLDPPSGSLKLGQNNEIGVKLVPTGCDITAVEFGLNYVSTILNVVSISPGSNAFGVVEAGDSSEGGRHYIFTRTPGSTLPQEVIIGKIIFKPTASAAASKGVFVNIVGVAGSDGLPYITVSGQGNLPATQKTVTSGAYNIL